MGSPALTSTSTITPETFVPTATFSELASTSAEPAM
jgi:hypothetical protein